MKKAVMIAALLMMAIAGLCSGLGILVTPPRFELSLSSGQSQTYNISIFNMDSANPVRLKAQVMDWSMKPNGQTIYPKPGTLFQSCTNWIDVNPAEFEIPPGSDQAVRYTIKVPDSAFGSYWSMIYFESQSDTTPQTMIGVVLKARVGSAVYVTIPGTEVKQADLTDFSYKRKGYDSHEFKLQVKNTGNTYLRPKGGLVIKDHNGLRTAALTITEQVVFPGLQRDLILPLKQALAPGRYTAIINLDCGTPELIQGETGFEVVK